MLATSATASLQVCVPETLGLRVLVTGSGDSARAWEGAMRGAGAAEVGEDLLEDRDEEHEHPDQRQDREGQDDERIDHRPPHAAANLHLLLDLDRDAVEDGVEDAGCLACLDHRDVEAVEGVGMPRHRL
jgi:hypothetical protein